MSDTLTIALRVRGAVDSSDPAFALLELTAPLGSRLLACMDQVRQLQTADPADPKVLSVDRTGDQLIWLVDVEPRLDDYELRRRDWAVLKDDRVTSICDAIDQDPALQAQIDAPELVCEPDQVSWRCHPRHGYPEASDEVFTTPDLHRDTLVELLARLG